MEVAPSGSGVGLRCEKELDMERLPRHLVGCIRFVYVWYGLCQLRTGIEMFDKFHFTF